MDATTTSSNTTTTSKPLLINLQYLKDFSFENPKAPGIYTELKVQPHVEVAVNVEVQKLSEEEIYEVCLHFEVKATHEKETVFVVDLKYAAIATLDKNIEESDKHPLLLVYCPSLLFPFARKLIAEASREGGFPPLLIDPVDFSALYQKHNEASKPTYQ